MRIITWNCKSFGSKYGLIKRLKADIVVVPECGNVIVAEATSSVWKDSDNKKNRGIGVFAFNGYRVELAQPAFAKDGIFVPIRIYQEKKFICNLLAVWPRRNKDSVLSGYPAKTIFALNKYSKFISSEKTIIAGDFNSHSQWRDHDKLLSATENLGLVSAYHEWHMIEHGNEKHPTLNFMYRNWRSKDNAPYHIDYIFVPLSWRRKIENIKVGSTSTLKNGRPVGSDHLPLIVDINLKYNN